MKLIENVTSIFSKKSNKKSIKKYSKKSISKSDPPSFGSSTSSAGTSSSSPRTVLNHKITKEELEDVIRKLGSLQDEIIESMVDDVTFEELGSENSDEYLAEMKDAFGIFDKNGDGKISAEELRGVLVILGEVECGIEECSKMIESVDSDGDGFVCFDDFVRMMRCDAQFV